MMQRQNLAFFIAFFLLSSSCATSTVVTGGNSSGASHPKGGSNSTSTTTIQSPSKKNDKSVNEDLSQYRPKFKSQNEPDVISTETQPVIQSSTPLTDTPLHVNKRLDAILDTIAMHNKSIKFTNGFRIQIYVGNDRKSADDAKIYTYQKYPEIFPYLSFQQPIYKVKIGDFLSRMDAERYLIDIKDSFPTATILPDRVEIKKGIMVSR